jgi:diaminopimelate decarboxylase
MPALSFKVPPFPEALLEVARAHGTPTYVYFEEIIRERAKTLRDHLAGIPGRLLYAMKANANPILLNILREEGFGVDAVSPGELLLATKVGFSPESILFSANNMTDEEMDLAHGIGALLNIGELSRLDRYGRTYPGSRVCVRMNPRHGAGHHSHVVTAGERTKFGVPVDEIERVKAIVQRHDLKLVGLHHHIGSGVMRTSELRTAMDVLLEAGLHVDGLEFLNFGGGLGIPYRPDEEGLDFEHFGTLITDRLNSYAREHPSSSLTFLFEPGRFLVAEAGVLLARINTIKETHGRTYAGTDTGMGQLIRPILYDAYHAVYNLSNPEGTPRTYELTGNICESGDILASNRPIQQLSEGDLVAILDAGAYGMSMASEYNLRPLPAEVLVSSEGRPRVIRRRQTPEQLADALLNMA